MGDNTPKGVLIPHIPERGKALRSLWVGRTHTIENEEAYRLVMRKAKEIVEEQSAGLIEGLGVDRAMLGRRVRELLDELMKFMG